MLTTQLAWHHFKHELAFRISTSPAHWRNIYGPNEYNKEEIGKKGEYSHCPIEDNMRGGINCRHLHFHYWKQAIAKYKTLQE